MFKAVDEADKKIKSKEISKPEGIKNACDAIADCMKSMHVARTTSAEINRLRRVCEHGWLREACNEMLAVYPTLQAYMDGDNPTTGRKRVRRKKTSKTSGRRQHTTKRNGRNGGSSAR